VSVEINNESGLPADEDALRELAQYVIDQMETHPLADLSMLLVDEAHMTNLHEKWMEEPGPTDVLSFPMDELRPHSMAGPNRARGRDSDEPEPVLLGDVVLCPQVAAAQAKQHGHSTQAELELLTVHGVLHLLGYDHAEPEEEAEMFGLQSELLRDWRDESAANKAAASEAPVSEAPVSEAPVSEAPASEAPASDEAVSEAAVNEAAGRPPESGEGREGPALCRPPGGCCSPRSC
jgi:probable rRNA maturation factor